MPSRKNLPQWQALAEHHKSLEHFSLAQSFADNPQRAAQLSVHACDIFYDYSKHRLTCTSLDLLLQLAKACQLKPAINDLFSTAEVNTSEKRPALHWLLRAEKADTDDAQLQAYIDENHAVQQQMKTIAEKIHNGQLRGYTGKPFTDIVNLGIGGSDLGPAMVYQALSSHHVDGIRCHYVANMCAHDLLDCVRDLDPHSTLFIISSKSFTTLETITNANSAKQWLLKTLNDETAVADHFFAVSSVPELAIKWGVREEHVFPFADWVGGRYSLWSSIGFSLCVGIGFANFKQLLQGARTMDRHFIEADFAENLPVLMALIGIWNTNFWQWPQLAVIPYDHRLRRFPAFLQQLEMESNGKHCTPQNTFVDYATCPTIWGEAGSNSQHSFFQLFHQGNTVVPIDFIAVLNSGHGLINHQDWLFTNCLAQSRALMIGQAQDGSLPAYQQMKGNNPSATLVIPEVNPAVLGSLIALYEHKVYVQSVIWDINPFDQWGVELGKKISASLHQVLSGEEKQSFDSSTEQLFALYRQQEK